MDDCARRRRRPDAANVMASSIRRNYSTGCRSVTFSSAISASCA